MAQREEWIIICDAMWLIWVPRVRHSHYVWRYIDWLEQICLILLVRGEQTEETQYALNVANNHEERLQYITWIPLFITAAFLYGSPFIPWGGILIIEKTITID